MQPKKTILITGVTNQWGTRLAERLSANPELHVIGLDSEKPKLEIKDLDFIQADIRNPLLAELLELEAVDTLVHLAFRESDSLSESAFEYNVMGAYKVYGACTQAHVRKIIQMSSTAVYGAVPTNSLYLTEDRPLKGSQETGWIRDYTEIESFCNGFRLQAPDILLTVLRFPSIVGPTCDTPLTRFLKNQMAPVLLGFDPLMQVIHEEDILSALQHAIDQDAPGVFNVAAEGVVPLLKLASLAGKFSIPVFHLFGYWGKGLLNSAGVPTGQTFPIEIDYLRYPWVGDLTRMQEELCFSPRYTAEEALREFAGSQRLGPYLQEKRELEYDQKRLRDTIERRRRAYERRQATACSDLDGDDDTEEGVMA
jgi:UDP-glucose 4-epimerase